MPVAVVWRDDLWLRPEAIDENVISIEYREMTDDKCDAALNAHRNTCHIGEGW